MKRMIMMVATAAAALSLVAFGFNASAQKQTTSSASRTTTSSTTTTSAATTPSRQTTTSTTSTASRQTTSSTASSASRQTTSSATTSTSSASRVTTPAASSGSKSTTTARSTTSTTSSSSGQTVRRTGDGTGSTTASRQTTTSTGSGTVSRQTTSSGSTTVSRQTTSSSATSSKQTTSARTDDNQAVSGRSSTGGTTSSGSRTANVVVKENTGSARANTNLTNSGLSTKVQEPEKASGRPLEGSYTSSQNKVEPYRDRGGNYRYDDREFRIDDHNIRRVPPRERDFMSYDRPGGFFYDKPHYYGYRVNYLPPRYRRVTYWGIDYYLYDGIYYRLHGSTYYVCRPPAGILVTRAIDRALLNLVSFAYFHNVHRTYSTVFDNAARIAEQNRIIAENNARIARQYSTYALNSNRALSAYEIANRLGLVQSYAYANSDYYYQDGVFYLFSASGQYTVIIPPAGALVTSLPEDYETIVLDGIEYYVVDNTVYRTTIFDCQPYLEVLGQMYGSMATKYTYYW